MSLHAQAVQALAGWTAPDQEQRGLRDLFLAHLHAHPDSLSRACEPGHITASTAVLDAPRRNVLLTLHPKVGRWLQLGGHCEPVDATLAAAALREATEESAIGGLVLLDGPVNLDLHAVPCGRARPPAGRRDPQPDARPDPLAGAAGPGAAEPGAAEPGAAEPGAAEPGAAQPGTAEEPCPGGQAGPLGAAGPAGWFWHLDVQFAAVAPPGARPVRGEESDDLRWWPVGSLPSSADDSLRRLVSRACMLSRPPR